MPIEVKRSRAVFQKLAQDLLKLSSKTRPDLVHRLRTGTRRLQILLGELSPRLDRNQKKLLKLLVRIRKRAGKIRDIDVQLSALRSLKIARQPHRKTELMNDLIEIRERQEKKLRKELDRKTASELRKRLQRAMKDFDPKKARDPLSVAKAMLATVQREDAPPTEALLHRYRILTKRARYAAEFAVPSPEATQFIAELERIQDALGDWHDWLTLAQSAKQKLGEVKDSPVVAELHNVTGAKFRHAVKVLAQMRAAHSRSKPKPNPSPAAIAVATSLPSSSAA